MDHLFAPKEVSPKQNKLLKRSLCEKSKTMVKVQDIVINRDRLLSETFRSMARVARPVSRTSEQKEDNVD